MKYQVILKKYEVYEVEADSTWEAEEKAFELCDRDNYAWGDPVDEVIVERLENKEAK